MHRDYSNAGRDIKIGIYDDILNIVSPGGLPNGLTMSDVQKGRSEIRNTVIARVFKQLNLVEQWGSGIQRIKVHCLDAGISQPIFSESGDFTDWEFPRTNKEADSAINDGISSVESSVKSSVKSSVESSVLALSKNAQKILVLLKNQPRLTIPELATATGISTRAIEKNLQRLQQNQLLQRIGAKKDGFWEVLYDI
jgi:ATP-dependent DNA helicase RecG